MTTRARGPPLLLNYRQRVRRSRGFSGAEELARHAVHGVHAVAAGPDFSVEEILEQPLMGSGAAMDRVLGLDKEERLRLSEAFGQTFWR
jgi:hypothetical protein